MEVTDPLESLRLEIEAFVSRENRIQRCRCTNQTLQKVTWDEEARTLILFVFVGPRARDHQCGDELLSTLRTPLPLSIFIPPRIDDKPFCFCEDDELVPAVDDANKRVPCLSSSTLLYITTVVLKCVERLGLGPSGLPSSPSPDTTNIDRKSLAMTTAEGVGLDERLGALGVEPGAAAIGAATEVMKIVHEDPLGAELSLSLLCLALSSYRRDTICHPFPQQLEPSSQGRNYESLLSALGCLPSLLEVADWDDPWRLLQLPRATLVALHFVTVCLPTSLYLMEVGKATPSKTETALTTRTSPEQQPQAVVEERLQKGQQPEQATTSGSASPSRTPGGLASKEGTGLEQPAFVFRVDSPSDPEFDAQEKKYGSSVAYHGSSAENFHSILNRGLRIMSGSRHMKNGNAFGDGIYLSASAKVAAGFALRGDRLGTTLWPGSLFGDPKVSGLADIFSAPRLCKQPGVPIPSCSADRQCPTPRRFQYRVVAKCRVLKGQGALELPQLHRNQEGTYFVVSDETRVRVEAFLLFHDPIALGRNRVDTVGRDMKVGGSNNSSRGGKNWVFGIGDNTRWGLRRQQEELGRQSTGETGRVEPDTGEGREGNGKGRLAWHRETRLGLPGCLYWAVAFLAFLAVWVGGLRRVE